MKAWDIKLSERLKIYLFGTCTATFIGILLYIMPTFSDTLSKEQVRKGLTNWLMTEGSGNTIRSIVERKGDDAGEIGYFFVELTSSKPLIVPADARIPIKHLSFHENYLDFYTRVALVPMNLPRYDHNISLKINGIVNFILRRQNETQRWWQKYICYTLGSMPYV